MNLTQKEQIDNSLSIRRRYQTTDFRAEEDAQTGIKKITGHPAVFNSKTNIGGWFDEIIMPGAFEGCDLTDVLFYCNHNSNKVPLARSRRNNGNSTMRLGIDNTGLNMDADIDIDNNVEARQVYSGIKRGDLDGMSFSFRIKDCEWDELDSDMPLRKITRIAKVYEVSVVNSPAYEDTDISARDKAALESAKTALDNARSAELENSQEIEMYKIKNKILGGL